VRDRVDWRPIHRGQISLEAEAIRGSQLSSSADAVQRGTAGTEASAEQEVAGVPRDARGISLRRRIERARFIELSSWAAAIVSIVVLIAIVGGLRFRLMLQKALTPRRAFNGRGNERC
jgi:hypothetical protein